MPWSEQRFQYTSKHTALPAVGRVRIGTEILEEAFPPEEEGEYHKLARTLPEFIPWETLRSFDVDPIDPEGVEGEEPERLTAWIEALPIDEEWQVAALAL